MDDVDRERVLNPPRTHTRASAMANTYVNTSKTAAAQTLAGNQSASIFKMRKFLAVKPRTSTINYSYKPVKRGQSELGRGRNKI